MINKCKWDIKEDMFVFFELLETSQDLLKNYVVSKVSFHWEIKVKNLEVNLAIKTVRKIKDTIKKQK